MGSDGAAACTFRTSPATAALEEASRRRSPPSMADGEEAPRPLRAKIETPSEEALTFRPVLCGVALATLIVVSSGVPASRVRLPAWSLWVSSPPSRLFSDGSATGRARRGFPVRFSGSPTLTCATAGEASAGGRAGWAFHTSLGLGGPPAVGGRLAGGRRGWAAGRG